MNIAHLNTGLYGQQAGPQEDELALGQTAEVCKA